MPETQGKVKLVKDLNQFKKIIKSVKDVLIVVDFCASWCVPCNTISPQIRQLAENMQHNVLFLEIDVEQNEEVSEKYEIRSLPTFLFFKNGVKINQFSGASMEKLQQLINQHT
ncbi:uncharacterized protein TRIADDRAFT_25254 [Trichoplax adhaerens]|uniref:Thioredoxin n=1 Tax=Trichoplax adhaerens TaxID=10228 RepID=B3RXW3_TRIAD|nr:hypothetical protein TRIADDRAFT_25254 [Trichoplax adhaerens]EDV24929.1 hypothetical protein TRIADDRAFT_25254 [Trichoplax adhaerens]|eukprot:XP_002112819.1 hypothetical protein TRIADDRAFT_25254 [Trichoplax adhaerens]